MSAPTAAKKRAPKKPAAKKEVDVDLNLAPESVDVASAKESLARVVNDDGSINPIQIGKRGRKGEDAPKRHHVFTLGTGPDEVAYYVTEPNIAMVMQYLTNLRKHGRAGATEIMAFGMLGDAALDALAASPDTEPEDVADVFTAVGSIFFGSPVYRALAAAPDPS